MSYTSPQSPQYRNPYRERAVNAHYKCLASFLFFSNLIEPILCTKHCDIKWAIKTQNDQCHNKGDSVCCVNILQGTLPRLGPGMIPEEGTFHI